MRTPHRRYSIRGFLKQGKPEFLALQETHLESDKIQFYVQHMTSDYAVLSASSLGRRRGVALLYRKEFKLIQSAADDQGRRLREELPPGTWIAGGDWNAILTSRDSSSPSNIQSEDEALEFQTLCNALGVHDARDVADRRHGPKFTRAQVREGKLIWSRLDRVYVPNIRVLKVTHHATVWASDHIPATAEVQLESGFQEEQQITPSAYFKADHYVVQQNIQHLKTVWENLETKHNGGTAMDCFLNCWFGLRKEIKALQYEKKQALTRLPEKEKRLNELLKLDAEGLIEAQEGEIATLIQDVRELQAWSNHRWRLTCRENYIKNGDVFSAYFFRRFQKRRARVTIKKLKNENGEYLETQDQIS
ncbi:hypothetical protein R1sor_018238 [Riccia sorocarpa]|uniref:Endonuclease/exonuclease/phosphatase domain-containing protein n=1 Tax=Riccia sorocarpa TaxID=122646 RepID=A0ABD3IA63_9MARC